MGFSRLSIPALLMIAIGSGPAIAQVVPDEHAQHHPAPVSTQPMPGGDQAAPAAPGGMAGGPLPGTPGGGMGGEMGAMEKMMGEMMKQMGAPPPKEVYPSLMALPDDVIPEQRAGIEQLARDRMKSGAALLSSGLERLSTSTSRNDYAAMQQAMVQMRQGVAELEAGLAARRLLAEGGEPRNLALGWFKREMNLASPIRPEDPRAFLGVTLLHLFTMGLLVAFALAMVAMYFFKMRRAAALFGRLEPGVNRPPPGSTPPLPGAPAPPANG